MLWGAGPGAKQAGRAECWPEATASASGKSKFAGEIAANVAKRSAPERRVTVPGTASGMRFHGPHRKKRGFTQSHYAYWKLRLRGPTGPRIHESRRGAADLMPGRSVIWK